MTTRGLLTGLLTVAVAAGGCAAGDLQQASSYQGDSGPVNWEIVVNVDVGARQLSLERKP